jgi:hypothetical protein
MGGLFFGGGFFGQYSVEVPDSGAPTGPFSTAATLTGTAETTAAFIGTRDDAVLTGTSDTLEAWTGTVD